MLITGTGFVRCDVEILNPRLPIGELGTIHPRGGTLCGYAVSRTHLSVARLQPWKWNLFFFFFFRLLAAI